MSEEWKELIGNINNQLSNLVNSLINTQSNVLALQKKYTKLDKDLFELYGDCAEEINDMKKRFNESLDNNNFLAEEIAKGMRISDDMIAELESQMEVIRRKRFKT